HRRRRQCRVPCLGKEEAARVGDADGLGVDQAQALVDNLIAARAVTADAHEALLDLAVGQVDWALGQLAVIAARALGDRVAIGLAVAALLVGRAVAVVILARLAVTAGVGTGVVRRAGVGRAVGHRRGGLGVGVRLGVGRLAR